MQSFSYSSPTQVVFGAGRHQQIAQSLPDGARRVVLVTGGTASASRPVQTRLEQAGLDIVTLRCASEPTVSSIDAALTRLQGVGFDAVIACGGGSVIDMGKVLRLALYHGVSSHKALSDLPASQMDQPCPMPCIALPTTAGTGAEATANAVVGIPDKRAKISLRGKGIYASLAIIDPDLMQGAPASVVLSAGLDAVTQIFESETSCAATPFSRALTGSARDKVLPALRRVVETDDAQAWAELAWISHLSGVALANSGLGAAHGLASVIGGRLDAPHGALCGRLLLPVLRQNLRRAPNGSEPHNRIRACVMAVADTFAPTLPDDPLSGLADWIDARGLAPLSRWGVKADDLPDLATNGMAASSSQKNAVPLAREDYLQILQAAL